MEKQIKGPSEVVALDGGYREETKSCCNEERSIGYFKESCIEGNQEGNSLKGIKWKVDFLLPVVCCIDCEEKHL